MAVVVNLLGAGTLVVVDFLGTTDGTVGFKVVRESSGQIFLGTGVVGQGRLRLVVGTCVVEGTLVTI